MPARHFKEGVFLANGGAAWFETERVASGGGLFEGSTPECCSPRQLLVYQRAQDALFAAALASGENQEGANAFRAQIAIRRHDYAAAERFCEAATTAAPSGPTHKARVEVRRSHMSEEKN